MRDVGSDPDRTRSRSRQAIEPALTLVRVDLHAIFGRHSTRSPACRSIVLDAGAG